MKLWMEFRDSVFSRVSYTLVRKALTTRIYRRRRDGERGKEERGRGGRREREREEEERGKERVSEGKERREGDRQT